MATAPRQIRMLWVALILCTVTNQSDALPVLVIDGASFVDFAGFVREFSQLLCHVTWNGSLGG